MFTKPSEPRSVRHLRAKHDKSLEGTAKSAAFIREIEGLVRFFPPR